ncbi:MipA/OmpV family protein [Marinimicrobium alkaliphilum]|uniref:MipA/OmpV family protein n=1 Tax=Marinimicrobium alkaliphilum TaxID=2202654 RepID=UPI0018E09016|nr:MipA/OmpV family protein [Marinimicrobium alkaliphilum]
MRLTSIAFFVLLSTLTGQLQAATLAFSLTNSPGQGELVALVFDDATRFGEFRDPLVRETFVIDSHDQIFEIADLEPGDYALIVFHDENRNGVLDRNFVGIPREPIALSNNYAPRGPPSFSRARISLSVDERVEQTLTLARPLGDRGQIGVGIGTALQSSPYVGSNTLRLQPIPTLVYFGDRVQFLGPIVNVNVYGSDRVRLAARAEMRFSAYDEDDSDILMGLGDRQTTVFGGLAVNTRLPAGVNLSLSYTHDLLGRIDAGIARASLSRGFQFGTLRLAPSVAVSWLDGDLANYEFGVPASAAREDRPAYVISDAMSWSVGMMSMLELTPDWMATVSLAYETLDSKIGASPIVEGRYLTRGFMALTYTF